MAHPKFAELFDAAQMTVAASIVRSDEKVVILTDTAKSQAMVDAFLAAALSVGADAVCITMRTRPHSLVDPPPTAIQAMASADIVFDLATRGWLYTDATNVILESGTRMLQVLVGEDTVIARPPTESVSRREKAALGLLKDCHTVRVVSAHGTDLTMERGDRPIHTQGGSVDHPGDWDSLGVSLAAFAPLETSANGRLVFHGTVSLPGRHAFVTERPIVAEVEDGTLVNLRTDHSDAALMDDWLRSWNDPASFVIAHTGFGIDPRANLLPADPGSWESYLGGVNVAFGGNNIPQLKGVTSSSSHFDAVLLEATVEVDGHVVIEGGRFVDGTGLEDGATAGDVDT